MPNMSYDDLMKESLAPGLKENVDKLRTLFNAPLNSDFIVRSFRSCGFAVALLYIEGMAGGAILNENVMEPCMEAVPPAQLPLEQRAAYLSERVLNVADAKLSDMIGELSHALLQGQSVLVADGCAQAVIMESRGYEKRNVDRPQNESVVIGAQQGFIENLRSNITLIRRMIRSPMLITETMEVGSKIATSVSLVYLKDVAEERSLNEIRRRIRSLDVDFLPDSGHLQSLIEDSSLMMLPQMLQTERPDRAAHCICDGQVAIMVDNSPYALIAPITFFHLIHAADDTYMRWQYASFTRLLRACGLLLSLFLPGLYVALTTFHPQVIPLDLLTSIAEARARVPFPVLVETLILELSFFMINEAGTRMPKQIGSALGIVGGLILGQAAVAADIISPILIIIVALSGLGNYVAPTYNLSIAVEILRLSILIAGAFMGLYGITLIAFVYLCTLCGARSLGAPMLAPFAPYRPHNPDLLFRMPTWMQKRLMYFAKHPSWLSGVKGKTDVRGWKEGGERK